MVFLHQVGGVFELKTYSRRNEVNNHDKWYKKYYKIFINCDFFNDDFDPEGKEEHLDMAHELQEKYPWSDIIDEIARWKATFYKSQ